MLSLGSRAKVFLVVGVTDMRKQFDSLAAIVSGTLKQDPHTGHIFVFCNRRKNRLKLLFWERSGFWVCAKRLEKGTFAWPDSSSKTIEMSSQELAMILAGIDLRDARKRQWYDRSCATG